MNYKLLCNPNNRNFGYHFYLYFYFGLLLILLTLPLVLLVLDLIFYHYRNNVWLFRIETIQVFYIFVVSIINHYLFRFGKHLNSQYGKHK